MPSTINAATTGIISTADNSGALNIQTSGTTAITISSAQAVTLANALPTGSGGTGTTTGSLANCTVDGTNPVGYRNIPQSGSDKTTSYSLTTSDIGKFVGVGTSGSITVPNSTFAAGDVVSIFNNTSGNITMTMSITTAYIAGTNADKDTMTLATRGVATILFISGTVCVVSGNVT